MKIKTTLAVIAAALMTIASCTTKSDVSVLYVAGSADIDNTSDKPDSTLFAASQAKRQASFEKFFAERFKSYKVVNAKDYKQEMSNDWDVTIFDGRPTPIRNREYIYGENGQITGLIDAQYLTDDFDRPALSIAEQSSYLGRTLGLKTDWYCLCLEDYAFKSDLNHEVFSGPWKVKIEWETKPTPEPAKEYAQLVQEKLPEEMQMWKVQTKSYATEQGYRVGMVSRPWGFLDSPDAEIISGGKCAKCIDAISICRHGNFLHWGFASSPDDLTEAAKNLLANCIVYISNFAGQKPIARKLNEGIETRSNIADIKGLLRKDIWQIGNDTQEAFNVTIDSIGKAAREKRAKGEKLSSMEEMYADFDMSQAHHYPPYEEYFKERAGKLFETFGYDIEKYNEYYDSNAPYFCASPDGYSLVLDEDIKSLGIANNNINLLDKCISMLENGTDVEKAERILTHYTLCRFKSANEWRTWFDTYKDKLFFTESGGWLWLVDSYEPNIPGNDYSVIKPKAAPKESPVPQLADKETTELEPVIATASLNDLGNGDHEVVIHAKVHTGWHIYAIVSDSDPFIPTEVNISLPESCTLEGSLVRPGAKPLGTNGTTVYEGDLVFRQKITGSGKGKVDVKLSWQSCNDRACLTPREASFSFNI
ncbi:MAG: hypothetical protein HUJ92_07895 [Bacteroidales bacterium]|nr:hypothetical protein [Bacteroidales bacterium]